MFKDKLAIDGGQPLKQTPFPEWPIYDDKEINAVTEVIRSQQWWRAIGTQVVAFEKEFSHYQNQRHALAVTNGTVAIEIVLSALGIGYGDEVIIPAFTFISTASAILCVNAVPVLVDIDPVTYCLDPEKVEAAITPRTRAIMPVHMAGNIADMDAIMQIAQKHNLVVLEDAAHAQGAEWKGQRVGALHTAGIFSFQAGKLMTAGEGGLIICNDEELWEQCFLYGNCGRPRQDRTYQHSVLGSNGRMSELHAAVLRAQLTRLDQQIASRESLAPLLDSLLQDIPGIIPQGRDARVTRHPHYMYMFRYLAEEFGGRSREWFVDALIAEGVPAFVAYPAIHHTPVFRNNDFGPRWKQINSVLPDYAHISCPVSEQIGEQGVWLHHRTLLGTEYDINELVACIKKIQYYACSQQKTLLPASLVSPNA